MGSPSIAHYGTTIMEPAPAEGVAIQDSPKEGALKGALRFFEIMGFRPLIENMYDGLGRQYIWNRGNQDDVDYVEVDSFTSFGSVERPATDAPRVGDTIFRLTHQTPVEIYGAWHAENLVTSLVTPEQELAFINGETDWTLFRGPHGQMFEFGPTQPTRAGNHAIYVWTDPAKVDQIAADFSSEFAMDSMSAFDFHGVADGVCLRRDRPGTTIGLLTPKAGDKIEPRWSEDIFLEAGYSHFRLGSPDKAHTLKNSRESFPDGGGDVSFVYYHDSYLELVQIHDDDPACADPVAKAA